MLWLWQWETTFWTDFSIADKYGEDAIKDTYKRAFEEWKNNLVYITEMVIVLNWKARDHSDEWNVTTSELYSKLWEKTHNWCCSHLKGEDLRYYLQKVD